MSPAALPAGGDRPLLSVLVPTWRRVDSVVEAVRSVGITDPSRVEIVVVDNGSDEALFAALKAALAPFPNVRLHRNDANLGMVRNWNRCIAHARGRWMGLMCSDDAYVPGGVARALRLLASLPEPALVIGDPKAEAAEARLPAGPETARALRLPIASGNFWHREVSEKLGGFDERLEYSADGEYWYRCARYFPLVTVREPFATYELHQDNYMWATWAKDDFLEQSGLLARTVLSHQHPELDAAGLERRAAVTVWKTGLAVYAKTSIMPGREELRRRYRRWLLRHARTPSHALAILRVTLKGLRRRARRALFDAP